MKRKVTIDVVEKPLESILLEISDLAKFTFSYDARILAPQKTIILHAEETSVKNILDKILAEDIDYKVSGNHLILLRKLPVSDTGKKEKYVISGHVYQANSHEPLVNVIIYEVSSLVSDVTDEKGWFSIAVPAQFVQLSLSLNKRAFNDTIIFIPPRDQTIAISLKPNTIAPPEKIKGIPLRKSLPVESLPLVQQLVPSQLFLRSQNMGLARHRIAQISFLPTLGTNLKMGGVIENDFSVNVLAGYAYSVNIFEMGGLFNIIRNDVDGFQIGGLGNMAGGNVNGIQIAGLFNHNRGSLFGLQVSGVSNMLIDTLKGVQISGISNILKGGMKGLQIAGINNITTENVDGIQVAGLLNIAAQDVQMWQIAGLLNVSQNVNGTQLAGLANYTAGYVRGFQFAGLINKAQNTAAFQVAGIGNIATGKVSGAQISGVFNYATFTEGGQIGLFNIADSASGTPIGFLSFVRKGFHAIEVSSTELFPLNIAFKTGVKKFYNIFSGGIGTWTGEKSWRFGYGFGSERPLTEKTFLNFEYAANWVNENNNLQKNLSLLNRLNINFGYRRPKGLTFSAGPSINLWLSEWRDSETGEYLTQLAPYTIVDARLGSSLAQLWIGGKVSIHW